MNPITLSDKQRAMLQRLLIEQFYPKRYYRYLIRLCLNVADGNGRQTIDVHSISKKMGHL